MSLNGRAHDRFVEIPGDPSFVRGLVQLDDNSLIVGSQAPAAIYEVDLQSCRVTSALPVDGEPNESIYAICVLPAEFADPPARLTQTRTDGTD